MGVEDLGRFETKQVVATGIKIVNAGDGLSKALAVDPEKFSIGERHYVVLEVVCKRVEHEAVKDAPNHRQRIHVFRAESATFVDDGLVRDAIEKQKIRLEEAEGVQRLGLGEDEE